MKRIPLIFPAIAVTLFTITIAAFAQHGRGGMGGPPMGSPSMGRGAGPATMPNAASPRVSSRTAEPRMDSKQPADMLVRHPQLDSKLQSELPAGTNLQQAAAGFKNLGQFVAAVHVSHNLGIPFDELKAKMTGQHAESLGKAIQDLNPNVDAKAETKKAEKQAKQDLNNS